eukprot:13858_5
MMKSQKGEKEEKKEKNSSFVKDSQKAAFERVELRERGCVMVLRAVRLPWRECGIFALSLHKIIIWIHNQSKNRAWGLV